MKKLAATAAVLIAATLTPAAQADNPTARTISNQIVATWKCQDQIGQTRTQARSPWTPHTTAYRAWQLNLWTVRRQACATELRRITGINRNLIRLAICETGGINGGQPLWTHHNSVYTGALGFAHSTWRQFKFPGYPEYAAQATPGQQLAVGRRLVERFGGYSSWPACHVRLGLPG